MTIQPLTTPNAAPAGAFRLSPGQGEAAVASASAARSTGAARFTGSAPAFSAPGGGGVPDAGTFAAVDGFLNLTAEGRDVFGLVENLSPSERSNFLNVVASLLRQGVIGNEYREVGGRPVEQFATTAIADDRYDGAGYYRRAADPTPRVLDLLA
jgi:hypothetical protein